MQIAPLIPTLAITSALGLLTFAPLLSAHEDGSDGPVATTIGTTTFIAAPALAFQAQGLLAGGAVIALTAAIHSLFRASRHRNNLRTVAPWLSAALLLLCVVAA